MKKSLFILLLLTIEFLAAQSVAKVENHRSRAMDVVLFTFGMNEPITIGTLSKSGELNIKFPEDIKDISDEAKEHFMNDADFTLFSNCGGGEEMLTEDENIKAIKGGYISLRTKENPYSGLLFMVTDEKLVPWLENYGNVDAVLGSYFEVVYMESDFKYQGECTSTLTLKETDSIVAKYSYDLKLNAGFNFIEYKIESLEEHEMPTPYGENVTEKIDKPIKIVVTSSQSSLPNTRWIAKYF